MSKPIKRKWYLSNWFSNFDPVDNPIVDEFGIEYYSVERAYQASKSLDRNTRLRFTDMSVKEGDIKRLGSNIECRKDWEEVKFSIMENYVRQKYTKNDIHQKELIRSYPHDIVEWNMWHDNVWGICMCERCINSGKKGSNKLGTIVMLIRREIMNNSFVDCLETTEDK